MGTNTLFIMITRRNASYLNKKLSVSDVKMIKTVSSGKQGETTGKGFTLWYRFSWPKWEHTPPMNVTFVCWFFLFWTNVFMGDYKQLFVHEDSNFHKSSASHMPYMFPPLTRPDLCWCLLQLHLIPFSNTMYLLRPKQPSSAVLLWQCFCETLVCISVCDISIWIEWPFRSKFKWFVWTRLSC